MSNEVEKLAEEFHNVWIKEAIAQGREDATVVPWRDLAENIKNYDRELARFVLHNFVRQPKGMDLNQIIELKNKFALEAKERTKQLGEALEALQRKEHHIGYLQTKIQDLESYNAKLKASVAGKVLSYSHKRFDPKKFDVVIPIIVEYFKEKALLGTPVMNINDAVVELVERDDRWKHETYRRMIQKLSKHDNPDKKLLRIRDGVYSILC